MHKENFSSPDLFAHPELTPSEKLTSATNQPDEKVDESGCFYNAIRKIIRFINFARNNVKFPIFVALFAFLCTLIPYWFLVSAVLLSSLMYWLYKSKKIKKSFQSSNFLLSYKAEKLQESSGILKTDDTLAQVIKQQLFDMYLSSLLYVADEKDNSDKKGAKSNSSSSNLTWLNVLIGRICFDFLVEDIWAQLVTERIQEKLNTLELPYFLSELTVKDILLHHASDPSIDERGLWVDIDVSYDGGFHITLETKLSFRRFKADTEDLCSSLTEVSKEEENAEQPIKSRSEEILKFIDRCFLQSPYFQIAIKNMYIKESLEVISNTPLLLTVEVQWLTGTLAINIPPWPTNRLRYGFRKNPCLSITAHPKLGQHIVTFTQVTEWIEKKLVSEFQKILVMPNMNDLIISIMQPSNNTSEA